MDSGGWTTTPGGRGTKARAKRTTGTSDTDTEFNGEEYKLSFVTKRRTNGSTCDPSCPTVPKRRIIDQSKNGLDGDENDFLTIFSVQTPFNTLGMSALGNLRT